MKNTNTRRNIKKKPRREEEVKKKSRKRQEDKRTTHQVRKSTAVVNVKEEEDSLAALIGKSAMYMPLNLIRVGCSGSSTCCGAGTRLSNFPSQMVLVAIPGRGFLCNRTNHIHFPVHKSCGRCIVYLSSDDDLRDVANCLVPQRDSHITWNYPHNAVHVLPILLVVPRSMVEVVGLLGQVLQEITVAVFHQSICELHVADSSLRQEVSIPLGNYMNRRKEQLSSVDQG